MSMNFFACWGKSKNMKILYKATTRDGQLQSGEMDAKDINEAAYFLHSKGYIPISIKPKTSQTIALPFLSQNTTGDLVLFTRQLSSILSSGLTLMQAMHIIKEQTRNETMRAVVTGIISDIQEGKSLSFSISKYKSVFSPIYISLIKAGESSGFLDKILDRLATNLEKEQKLKSTISSALLYPGIIVTLMVLVMSIMMIFVVPQLTALYDNLGIELPFTTQLVIGVSSIMVNFWPLILGGGVLLVLLYQRWTKTDSGELVRDELILKIPVFGKLIQLSLLTEFSRTLGMLIGAGTLVVASLNESAGVTGNRVYRIAIADIARRVEKGVTIGDAMSGYPLFPPVMVQMVKIGEQTGKLDESLLKVSEYFEREVEGTVKGLTTALEPMIMIVLGLGVAFLITSVITPIYNLTSSIQ
jgi:type IV pilus assembly protein PilC